MQYTEGPSARDPQPPRLVHAPMTMTMAMTSCWNHDTCVVALLQVPPTARRLARPVLGTTRERQANERAPWLRRECSSVHEQHAMHDKPNGGGVRPQPPPPPPQKRPPGRQGSAGTWTWQPRHPCLAL
ncbi:hypothetical protein PCL_03709 [Purpureocillium lilacinum]|uniref:Uncharacterized protein n=1 Tax=Purpureocillium lilacinum TaxID=33203 RepID=A0A2U3EPU6_PURLI|nr:hypothetical protein Purlil1_2328 [Purpureocillium lilacinum]PWI76515.1 hypothetical protein PCL_03709 [Purpureocillium lilacinum]